MPTVPGPQILPMDGSSDEGRQDTFPTIVKVSQGGSSFDSGLRGDPELLNSGRARLYKWDQRFLGLFYNLSFLLSYFRCLTRMNISPTDLPPPGKHRYSSPHCEMGKLRPRKLE